MPDETYWLELSTAHGIDHDGNLEPLADIGVSMIAPELNVGGVVLPGGTRAVKVTHAERIAKDGHSRLVPDARIVETRDHRVRDSLLSTGLFNLIDPPDEKRLRSAAGETKAHRETMRRRDEQVAAGNIPAPDASDRPQPDVIPGQAPLTAAVFTADERIVIDQAIEAGSILSDEALASWVAGSPVDDIVKEVGTDALFAKRVLAAESVSAKPRKTLVDAMEAIS